MPSPGNPSGAQPVVTPPSEALAHFVAQFKHTADAIIDSWFIVDHERNIVEFNRTFYGMLPRNVARELNICKEQCIAHQCWRDHRQVRLDEIKGVVPGGDGGEMRFILSALPIYDDAGNPIGALEIQRNVTDEATVQVKYQEMLESEARERE